jgi:hypothetical protein
MLHIHIIHVLRQRMPIVRPSNPRCAVRCGIAVSLYQAKVTNGYAVVLYLGLRFKNGLQFANGLLQLFV